MIFIIESTRSLNITNYFQTTITNITMSSHPSIVGPGMIKCLRSGCYFAACPKKGGGFYDHCCRGCVYDKCSQKRLIESSYQSHSSFYQSSPQKQSHPPKAKNFSIKCSRNGCDFERCRRENGYGYYDYCCQSCVNDRCDYKDSTVSSRQFIHPPKSTHIAMKCVRDGCPYEPCPKESGYGFYPHCCRSCSKGYCKKSTQSKTSTISFSSFPSSQFVYLLQYPSHHYSSSNSNSFDHLYLSHPPVAGQGMIMCASRNCPFASQLSDDGTFYFHCCLMCKEKGKCNHHIL